MAKAAGHRAPRFHPLRTGNRGYVADVSKRPKFKGDWVRPELLGEVALPTVMRKMLEHGLADDGPLFRSRSSLRSRKP